MAKEGINIPVGVDTRGLQTGMSQAAEILKKSGEQMSATVTETANKTSKGFQTLQQSYRATYKDAQILATQQGVNSQAFLEATQKAGAYKNQLDDVAEITKVMSSDTPLLTASLGVATGLAGGFAAAQGAMALFGVESKAIEETMLKVQASIALVSGLQALGGLTNAFTALKAAVVQQVIPALVSLNAIIMANPFIAIATAILAIGTAVYLWTNRTKDNTKAIEENIKANQAQRTVFQKIIDFRIASIKDVDEREKAQLIEKQRRERAQLDLEYSQHKDYNTLRLAQAKMFEQELTELVEKQTKKRQDDVAKIIRTKKPKEISSSKLGIGQDAEGGFQSAMSNIIQGSTEKGWANINAANLKGMATWKENFGGFITKVGEVAKEIEIKMSDMAMPLTDAIDSMVNAAMDGGNVGDALAESLLSSMGAFMKQWGAQLILVGLGAEALKVSLQSLNGVAAIVAGVALYAAGSVASNMAKNFSSSGAKSTGGYSGSGGNYNAQNYQPDPIQVGGIVRGSDLQIVLINTNNQTRRVR